MLIFLSDIHFTDGTLGSGIKPAAFAKFVLEVREMAQAARTREVEIVLLGDIFDVLKSERWFASTIRPWSGSLEKDGSGNGLKEVTRDIVEGICGHPINRESVAHLNAFKKEMEEKNVPVRFTYLIGNHDRLVNRYPDTRVSIAGFLGMEEPHALESTQFPTEKLWLDYRVFARHGDIYDPANYDGNRDEPSLGDAVIIELVTRFPKEVENTIGNSAEPLLISRFKEIDGVRPYVDIPLWIQGVCRGARNPETGQRVKKIWNTLVEDFLRIEFVKKHDRPWKADPVDFLKWGHFLNQVVSLKDISRLPLGKLWNTEAAYGKKAALEETLRGDEADFVVYGHTHMYTIEPLEIDYNKDGSAVQKLYLNTGTWEKVHVRAIGEDRYLDFLSWHVMTFVAFYQGTEREDRRFEVWNGALG